jgi:glycosyltransferase involved in cell wall biosynthesis/predicted O-methyltransferase YrrM
MVAKDAVSVECVIPVCNQCRFTEEILGHIAEQTYVPPVIIIDNGSQDDTVAIIQRFQKHLDIKHVRNPSNVGVNNAWNQGLLLSSAMVVSILNNDLVLPKFFFEAVQQVFFNFPRCGYLVPVTVDNPLEPGATEAIETVEIRDLPFREGWAHSVRRAIPMSAGPIPSDEIYTFYGDDYLYHICVEQGFARYQMVNVPIHHYLSQTLYATGTHEKFGDDEVAWRRIRDARGAGTRPDGQKEWRKFQMKLSKETEQTSEPKVAQSPTLPKPWKHHWKDLPAAIDMACYAEYYQQAVVDMMARLPEDKRKTMVEIGARFGCSARIMLDAARKHEHWHMVLIDPTDNQYLVEVVDDSRVEFWQTTGEEAAKRFKDDRLALVHIDVDPHEYEQTKNLFNLYAPKVRVGGVVLFHDCTSAFGVINFVSELRNDPNWQVDFCPAHPESPISAPAKAVKIA